MAEDTHAFQPFTVDKVKEQPHPDFVETFAKGTVPFENADAFWKAVEEDPFLRAGWEKQINARIAQKLKVDHGAECEKIFEQAKQAGHEAGREEAKTELAEAKARLNEICESVWAQKAEILVDHEAHWAKAFSHLCERLMLPRGREQAAVVTTWVKENVERVRAKGKVQILVAEADFALLESSLMSSGESRWTVKADPTLKPGEVRCNTNAGGFFFSPENELKRLEGMIERFFAENT